MKNIKLSVPDNKFPYFLSLIKDMGFVKVLENDSIEISNTHKKILDERLSKHIENPTDGKNWQDVKKKFDKSV